MKYWAVTVRKAHCGTGQTAPITFYLQAQNIIEAMDRAKKMPGVKHGKPCFYACEITKEFFDRAVQESAYHRITPLDTIRKLQFWRKRV